MKSDLLSYGRAIRDHAVAYRRLASAESCDAADVRTVLLVLSASRGGSSLLYELLAESPDLLSLAGEHVPFYKLHGFDAADRPDRSDRLTARDLADLPDPGAVADLGRTLMSEVRVGPRAATVREPGFAGLAAFRLALQWPALALPWDDLLDLVESTAAAAAHDDARPADPQRFLALVLRRMAGRGLPVRPQYHDLPAALLAQCLPQPPGPAPDGPPNPVFCLEELPFIAAPPRRLPGAEEIRTKPLLLKAPLDAYRRPLIRALFPNARIKVLHLTRNPAASVNGLYDGWLDRGFFSHRVDTGPGGTTLQIGGYSTSTPGHWSAQWWNFDLPPGWQDLADAPLEDVCAFQWASVHEHILAAHPDASGPDVLRVRFEDVVQSPQRRSDVLTAIRDFAGVPHPAGHGVSGAAPVVMATRPPAPDRWTARRRLIEPALRRPRVAQVADHLGYPPLRTTAGR
ncbi:MAG TPA: hypothetical protein VGX23_02660 [Actinocrinis sp.]|nr:hypothetical protein [Actinocrinis sp.]